MKNSQISFKKFSWKVNGRPLGLGTSPEADWKIIFTVTAILIIIIIIISIYLFIKVSKNDSRMTGASIGDENKVLDIKLLKETVLYYQNKSIEFERIKNLVEPSADPSI